ncbi:MAG TPA: LLM class flavin-dependent oxidoreductase [Actinomycetota bacterium]|nr:LLM class flavin-dependent oxidoreductase [Actinomycetota bacterium]
MRLGYGLITCERYPGDPRTWADRYREALDLARLCERVGLDSVWTSEHHFVDDGYMPSLAVTSAAIAAVTDRIEIGTGVMLAPLHHPLRLAEDAATVDCIAGGRFVLGLGAGWRAEEFERLAIPRDAVGRRLGETVRVLRAAWGPEPFEFHGKVFDIDRTNVTPKPPRPIPVFIGGSAEGALRRAGRLGDGFLASTTPLEVLPRQVATVREGLVAAGRDPSGFRFWIHEPVWVTNDPEKDIDEALRQYWFVRWKYLDMAGAVGRPSDPPPQPPPLDDATAATLRGQLVYGTPEQVAERISAFGAVLGEGAQFIARAYYPGLPSERAAELVELLGEVRRLL